MGLDKFDFAIIALYLAGITLFGLRFRKRQRSLRDYFLADRSIPWWAIALSIVAAETSTLTIISIPALTLIYTFEGGLAAVIWTDVVQTVIYVGGTLVGLFTIIHLVPGGWIAIQNVAAAAGKFHAFDFSLNFWKPYTFWAGLIGGAFLTTASHGTDQLIVQRLLAARNQRQSVAALLSSGIAILFQFALFLTVGVMLYAFYRAPSASFGKPDRIYPQFIVSHMPHGISGLLIAAILAAAMSNLSAALNSLSSSSVFDCYLRHSPSTDERRRLQISRIATVVWALVLFGLAVLSLHKVARVVEVGLQIASVAYGALLGVFLLGVLTRRANQNGAMLGMLCGFAVELYIWLWTRVPWTWYVMIGTVVTFGVGYAASAVFRSPGSTDQLPTQNL